MKKIILLASLAFSINAFAQVPSYVPTSGLQGWYPFSGNANDQSSNGNNGTINGATLTTDRFGITNSAYSFGNSGDYIEVSTANGTLNSQSYTFSFWTKNSSISGDAAFISRLQPGSGPSNVYDNYCFFASAGKANLNYKGTDGNMHSSANNAQGPDMLGNVWKHIVITVAPDSIRSYLNGVLIKKEQFLFGINYNNSYPLRFGKSNNSYWAEFNGIMDDIGIWNRALTPTEINDLYNGNLCYQYITVTDTLLINTNITGFNPVTYQNTIKIYPNPTNDHITIDNGNIANLTGYQIKITNSLSQQVFQSTITQQQFYVDLSTWTGNGIYFVHIIDGQGNTIDIKKIILQ